jgi:hypothetical protein
MQLPLWHLLLQEHGPSTLTAVSSRGVAGISAVVLSQKCAPQSATAGGGVVRLSVYDPSPMVDSTFTLTVVPVAVCAACSNTRARPAHASARLRAWASCSPKSRSTVIRHAAPGSRATVVDRAQDAYATARYHVRAFCCHVGCDLMHTHRPHECLTFVRLRRNAERQLR